jgi:hypothetical protein
MRSGRWQALAGPFLAAAALTSLLPGRTYADNERAKAWVWADQPSVSAYIPAAGYQFNSAAGDIHVTRAAKGLYMVDIPGLETTTGGTVQVSAYGGAHHCNVSNWLSIGTALRVTVRCFVGAAKADGKFTMLFYKESRGGAWTDAYLWADKPAAASYTPDRAYQWNSKGLVNTIRRIGAGQYSVRLPGLNLLGGHAQVTTYGDGTQRCKVASWGPSGSDTVVDVRCFTVAGAKANAMFTLSYMTDVGLGVQFSEYQHNGGYARADQPTAPSYTPDPRYRLNTASPTISAIRLGVGSYRVRFGSLKHRDRTTAKVTAFGTGSEYCSIDGWAWDGVGAPSIPGTHVFVKCFKANRLPVDTRFTLLYLTDEQIVY